MNRIKITKLEEVENPRHPNNKAVGYEKTGTFVKHPKVGELFSMRSEDGKFFTTSRVVEIVDETTFKTRNSVYQIKFL